VRLIQISCSAGLLHTRQWSAGIRKATTQASQQGQIDIFHDFGVWLPGNRVAASAAAGLGVPFISSTCGMLAPWALRHKAWKKKLAWWLYQRRDLSSARVLVATARPEVEHIRRLFPNKPVALVPNGVELPPGNEKAESGKQKAEIQTVLFLGRIHPVKGLMNLIEAWSQVRPSGWRCVLAGPDEGGHRAELEAVLCRRGIVNDFTFAGMVDGDEKWRLLQGAALFVLPSFTENFGIAIAEALAAQVPVITTKGTPWEELVSRRCGWWVDLGVEPLVAALREATTLGDEQRRDMGRRGRRLVEEKYAWPKIGQDMKAVYEWVLNGGEKPSCIIES